MTKPVLIYGYGNLSRGDDALGPLLLDNLVQNVALEDTEILTDFQLQLEHALDLKDRKLVLFVDASVADHAPFRFTRVLPARDNSYTTHAMSPSAVLQVYESIIGLSAPPAFLLSIQGLSFELGEGLSAEAKNNLSKAASFAGQLIEQADETNWAQKLDAGTYAAA